MKLITEQTTRIKATLPKRDANKKQEVFYNPLMKSNRNISIVLLNSIANKKMGLALPLAGSGVRGLRFLKELKKGKLDCLYLNDKKENFVENIEENLELNSLSKKKIKISNEDAEQFLLGQSDNESFTYFDYIDIDPFGTPNPFISVAVNKIKRNGILAITATDTAALTGTYPQVTKRKYWARSLRNYMMHEIGLRILIRKVQLQGIQFDKAMVPILAYHKDHYFRIYFRSEKGKVKCDELIKQHQYLLFCPHCLNHQVSKYNLGKCSCGSDFDYAGPMWTGKLFDSKLVSKMVKENKFVEEEKFLKALKEEAKLDRVGFYDLHVIGRKYKIEAKKMDLMLKKLKGVRTHFSKNGIKTEKGIVEILKIIKK